MNTKYVVLAETDAAKVKRNNSLRQAASDYCNRHIERQKNRKRFSSISHMLSRALSAVSRTEEALSVRFALKLITNKIEEEK